MSKFCAFKINDLITGLDRSYVRSIYEVMSLEPFSVRLHIYNGWRPDKPQTISSEKNPNLKPEDFRVATDDEVREAYIEKPLTHQTVKKFYIRQDIIEILDQLYLDIEHGDEDHRIWLHNKIEETKAKIK